MTPDGREAAIPLTLFRSVAGEIESVQAVIDTGFTDRLTLPPEIVEELNLPLRGSAEVALADGSIETLPIHRVRLLWHGQERTVRSLRSHRRSARGHGIALW